MFEDDFRMTLENIIEHPEKYSKDELYEAFLEVTERYLNELISSVSLEKALIDGLDKEAADKLLSNIAISDAKMLDLEESDFKEGHKKQMIKKLLDFIEFQVGLSIE
ncbi:MAG: hypothetical protein IJL19_00970 [Clostridiales bacterium]|nr:hypothetical protein [Clostridiales bacterium]